MLEPLQSLDKSKELVPLSSGRTRIIKIGSESPVPKKRKKSRTLSPKSLNIYSGSRVKLKQDGSWYVGIVHRWGKRKVVIKFGDVVENWSRKTLISIHKKGHLELRPPKDVSLGDSKIKELRQSLNLETTGNVGEGTAIEIRRLKKRLKKYKSAFKKGVPEIHKMVHEGNSARAATAIQKHLLLSLTEMIPLVENAVLRAENGRGVYSLNSLISQARELIADIQSERDHGAIAQRISTEILHQAMILITQNLASTLMHIKQGLEPYLKDGYNQEKVNSLFNDNIRDMGRYISQMYQDTSEKVSTFMVKEG